MSLFYFQPWCLSRGMRGQKSRGCKLQLAEDGFVGCEKYSGGFMPDSWSSGPSKSDTNDAHRGEENLNHKTRWRFVTVRQVTSIPLALNKNSLLQGRTIA